MQLNNSSPIPFGFTLLTWFNNLKSTSTWHTFICLTILYIRISWFLTDAFFQTTYNYKYDITDLSRLTCILLLLLEVITELPRLSAYNLSKGFVGPIRGVSFKKDYIKSSLWACLRNRFTKTRYSHVFAAKIYMYIYIYTAQ